MAIESTNANEGAGVSRRRIVQGAAWATPAILIATAAPAFAGSNPDVLPILSGGVVGPASADSGAQTLTVSAIRTDNNSTWPIVVTQIVVEYIKGANGSVSHSVVTAGWQESGSVHPGGNSAGQTGSVVLEPVSATGVSISVPEDPTTTPETSIAVQFTLSRYSELSKLTIVATANGQDCGIEYEL
ncbi:hypothetical protein [Demequina maris]|uniref:hypothetical protein n=1 Tax=Demequina maris TaxID=1638982 RepID=UPI000A534A40|nr:hypothetical protein [Demequina maris]